MPITIVGDKQELELTNDFTYLTHIVRYGVFHACIMGKVCITNIFIAKNLY